MKKPLILKEAVITSITKNTYREVTVKLKVHPSDYSPEIEEMLFSMRESGESLVVALQSSDYVPPPEDRSKNLSKLHLAMQRYASFRHVSFDVILADIYKRYGIQSRTELTDKQIADEIDRMTEEEYG